MIKEFEELTKQINDLYNGGGFSCIYGEDFVQIRSAMLRGGTQVIIYTQGIQFDGCIDFKLIKIVNDFVDKNDVNQLFQDNTAVMEGRIGRIEKLLSYYHFEQADAFDILGTIDLSIRLAKDNVIDDAYIMSFLEQILQIIALAYDMRNVGPKENAND